MQLTRDSALEKLAKFGMDDMPVIEYIPNRCVIDKDWFQKYSMLRREFLASLTDSFDEIAFMNLSQEEFMNLMMGKKMPENTSLRFRIPLIWGGKPVIHRTVAQRRYAYRYCGARRIVSFHGTPRFVLRYG